MLPIPTGSAIAMFAGSLLSLLAGIAASYVPAVVLGSAGLVLLASILATTMPLGRQVRRQRLEFAWWLEHGPGTSAGAVVPNTPFEVRCYVRHRAARPLVAHHLTPVLTSKARVVDGEPRALRIRERARTEFAFRIIAPTAGRLVLHGLAVRLRGPLGLFEVPLYFPNPLAIRVLPRAAARVRAVARLSSGLTVERSGRTQLRRRGGGTELYELRELQPGDPFNSIAWKASARYGRLMVKEVEREVQETRWIILDVSGSMRAGKPGSRKLDFAIEAAAAEARRAIQEGDRVGLLTVDGRILAQVTPGDGALQMPRIYDALLGATEVVDEDLTALDDDELIALVGRYVRQQDGIDFAKRERAGSWDVPALVRHVSQGIGDDADREPVRADNPVSGTLRRFCRTRGIALPYRANPRDGSKGPGLAAALRIAGGGRSPSSIAVVSDLDGIADTNPVEAALKLAIAHGHQLAFIVPDAVRFAPPPADRLESALYRVYGRTERHRLRMARTWLGRLGIPVRVAAPADAAGTLLGHGAVRRRAA